MIVLDGSDAGDDDDDDDDNPPITALINCVFSFVKLDWILRKGKGVPGLLFHTWQTVCSNQPGFDVTL